MARPMLDMLKGASRRMSLHMPGHHGRVPMRYQSSFALHRCFSLDTTELSVTDDLYAPMGGVKQAQRLLSQAAGAAGSILLHGGSSAGIHAMLLYALHRGDTVILPRNAHKSALSACMLYGLRAAFAKLSYTQDGYAYTDTGALIQSMDANPKAKAVLLTSPDYYGMMADVNRLGEAAHARGMLLLVDEAHGAHLNWQKRNAIRLGADMAVQSAHKTLPALTGAAFLHYNTGVDAQRLLRLVGMAQTSSPSFLLMLSMDDARAWMDAHGACAIAALEADVASFWKKAGKLGYRSAHALWQECGLADHDSTRLVIDAPQGGYALMAALEEASIDAELCDERRVVCILSLLDGNRQLRKLLSVLRRMGKPKAAMSIASTSFALPKRVLPLDAAFACRGENVALTSAAGRVCLDMLGFYPPGTPVVLPGELMDEAIRDALLRAPEKNRFGVADGCVRCATKEEMRI